MKLKANALFIVIVFSLVFALMCSAVVLMAYFSREQISRNLIQQQLLVNLKSGYAILAASSAGKYEKPVTIDLFDEGRDSVTMFLKPWGVFEVGGVKAFFKRDTASYSFLLGYKPDTLGSCAIWLVDNERPLSIAGNTKIVGDCYLPASGISSTYIEGKGYFSKELVTGKRKRSKSQIPVLNEKIKNDIIDLLKDTINTNGHNYHSYLGGKERWYSGFDNPTLILTSDEDELVISKTLSGNIIINTPKRVFVSNRAVLSDVQIYAASVVIEDGFHGNLQVFARDSITVGEDVQLAYPSALALIKTRFTASKPFIRIEKDASVKGVVVMDVAIKDRMKVLLDLQEGAVFTGQAYVNGYVCIRGRFYGNVVCDWFNYKSYDNHLVDAVIDRTQLPKAFVGSSVLPSKSRKEVVKWL